MYYIYSLCIIYTSAVLSIYILLVIFDLPHVVDGAAAVWMYKIDVIMKEKHTANSGPLRYYIEQV